MDAQKIVKFKAQCDVKDIPIKSLDELVKKYDIKQPVINITISDAPVKKDKPKKSNQGAE